MSGSQNKNNKSKASKRDRLLSQGFPLLVCAAIIGFVLFNEMRDSLPSQKKSMPPKDPAPVEELQDGGDDKGKGASGNNEEGESKKNGAGAVSSAIEQVKKSAEAVKNLIVQPRQSSGKESNADPAADREFINARLSNSEDNEETPLDVLWGSMVFSDINCKLADRPDLNISLSIELFYNSKTLSLEVSQKQVVLEQVTRQVMSGIEFGAVQNTMLRARLLNAFNNVLETGRLWKVDIKNFVIDKG